MMTKWKRDSSTYLGTNFPTTYLELFFESTSLSNEEVASNREREREREMGAVLPSVPTSNERKTIS